ncbi:MAG: M23 family metallopeptidase [Oscillospiraceae bacterium]|nr:M23 family metallopeptidase [Oscillospiraceae bacterium]
MVFVLGRIRPVCISLILLIILLLLCGGSLFYVQTLKVDATNQKKEELIKWVDFKVPSNAMEYAIKLDIASKDSEIHFNWIEMLSYLAAKNGNNFRSFKTSQLDEVANLLKSGKTMSDIAAGLKYYDYYLDAYNAALSGILGTFEIEVDDPASKTGKRWERRYGIKAFSPIAKGYYYNDFDDFGVSRSYGFTRRHLGHDMMGSIGTPIIAVEGGVVEALGWNQYGGWRIGIRSHDTKRYYYYAHLRKDFPYNKSLKVGSIVKPGDVIGYLGRTGYSLKENVNNIRQAHLHIGLQLVFDESQKECNNEIWINIYPIIKLLYRNRCQVVKDPETMEFNRVYDIREIIED